MTYSEKLRDPRWQKKRLKIMEYANWRCQICGCKDNTLHCHHSYYTRGKQPWQYPDGAIICICEGCHEKIHGRQKQTVLQAHAEEEKILQERLQITPSIQEAKSKFALLREAVERVSGSETKLETLADVVRRISG